jgi:hypothetical protein
VTRQQSVTPQQAEALFAVVWAVAMASPRGEIRTPETRIPRRVAQDARRVLEDMGYDWRAAHREIRKARGYRHG